jgi:hypothetical protein
MPESVELWIILKEWDSDKKGWPVSAFHNFRGLRLSSLRTSQGEIPAEEWTFDKSADVPFVDWKPDAAPPDQPIAVVTFPKPTLQSELWQVVSRVNKLTGILVLIGTLGTAYFAYLGARSQQESDHMAKQIEQWHDDLKPVGCSSETDAQRAVTECVSRYAKDKQALVDADKRLDAILPSQLPCN